ncbi:MAG: tyrosine-type recombinase/integrase [Deltaproteobacteria bacterium]|nr:tyrosine-type recombinase/integrase [Deltaproteobacteria bacterium]
MTETVGIHQDVTNSDFTLTRQFRSHYLPSTSGSGTLSYKRRILNRWTERLIADGLPGNELVTEYLRGKYIKNLSVHTIYHAGGVLLSFMRFLNNNGSSIFTLTRNDISAFVEYEQDRGLKATSIISHLIVVYAFIMYLVRQEVIAPEIMKPKVRIQEPDALPKAIPKEDIECILDAIASVRDRALILLLLRTGMRIGELLAVKLEDIVLHDQKILIYLGSKNYEGRVVYYSSDAEQALKHWLRIRDKTKSSLFYGRSGNQLSYSAAWGAMRKTLERAGLSDKGYSLHSLRHTFATEMLNAGMRIEVLQQLLGHKDIELTLRYARLSDRRREEDYYRAMAIIERGGPSDEPYRRSTALQKVFEEKKLLRPHKKKLSK